MESIFVQIGASTINAIDAKVNHWVDLAPFVLGAAAIFLFGWILAEIVERAILNLSDKLRLEIIADKIGLKHYLERRGSLLKPSQVLARTMKGYLIFVFFIEATKVAQLVQVSDFLTSVLGYIPEVLIAIFIMLVGIRVGHTMELITSTSLNFAKSNTAHVLGIASKYTIITFAILAALSQLQIAEILIQTLFVGFVTMLTLAGGLAFGLGGKDIVRGLLQDIKRVEIRVSKPRRAKK
ncbi:hypothetical protein IPJ72_01635 [Candidatus Peregrinibacteria bacterium]|nr:MAG: hypothetical protein IPJ72_01635 [Candidatus Peregrinibacteria bacterium]